MKKLLSSTILASAMVYGAAASAQGLQIQPSGFNNTWVDVEYVDVADGAVRARGSYGFDKNLNAIGSVILGDGFKGLTGGVSYAVGLQDKLDMLLHAELTYIDVDCAGSCDDTDFRLGSEFRFQLMQPLELYGDIYYQDGVDFDLGARYTVKEGLKIIGGVDFSDDETLHIGARIEF